jgi:hypothetical protein
MTGTPSRTARVPIVRGDLKEAVGKLLPRGTRTACEAVDRGQGSVGVRSPMSSGTIRCICGGDGRKGTRLTLGDLFTCLVLGLSRGRPTGGQKSADGIVGNRQAELVRHSKAERWSKQIGRAVPRLPKARTREPGPSPQPRVPQETP